MALCGPLWRFRCALSSREGRRKRRRWEEYLSKSRRGEGEERTSLQGRPGILESSLWAVLDAVPLPCPVETLTEGCEPQGCTGGSSGLVLVVLLQWGPPPSRVGREGPAGELLPGMAPWCLNAPPPLPPVPLLLREAGGAVAAAWVLTSCMVLGESRHPSKP